MERESRILVVDDDKNICELIRLYLQKEGYTVEIANDGLAALEKFSQNPPAAVVLDIMLPKIDGIEVLKRMRKAGNIPVIMLTAKIADSDKIMGLTIGADDYITKPFNPLEVVARVKTQLRRCGRYNPSAGQAAEKNEHDIRGLQINRESDKCLLFGKELSLTPIEFSILWYLCEHQGRVVSSEELFEAVWKEKYLNNNNTVMAHIGRLREKMKEPAKNPKFIKTVWGVGYEIE